jgi:tetratricopeptide (TPR) repeat protein
MLLSSSILRAQSASPGRLPSFIPIPNPNVPATNATNLQRPLYVTGRVILEDGTAPPDLIAIQMVCGGNARSMGFTDSKGRFDVDLNDRKQTVLYSDASEAGSEQGSGNPTSRVPVRQQAAGAPAPTARNFAGCELQASFPGFRSDRINLMNQRSLEDPNVGAIVLHRRANVEGVTISATSAYAPKDAKKLFDKALNQEQKSKWPEAERDLQKAVDTYPKYAAAWFHLGFSKQQQNNVAGARLAYAKALDADPRYVNPYQMLALLAAREEQWPEVLDRTDRLLNLNPIDFPDAWMYNAMAKFQLHRFEAAEQSARQGLLTDAAHRFPKLDQILGIILIQKHQYPEAAQHMRAYLRQAPDAADSVLVQKQLAEVERRLPPQVTAKRP